MLCTRCGTENSDDVRNCVTCGRKLQSFFRPVETGGRWKFDAELPRLRFSLEAFSRRTLRRHLEAWALCVTLLATVVWCARHADFRPLYVLGPVIAVLAWWRRP